MRFESSFFAIAASLLLGGCIKVSESPAAVAAKAQASSARLAAETAVPRYHAWVSLMAMPPRSPQPAGTRVVFDYIQANYGDAYDSRFGIFTPERAGFYDIQAMLSWPPSPVTAAAGICQIFLYIHGVPIPGAMATSPYLPGQPCSVQLATKVSLDDSQGLYIASATTLSASPTAYPAPHHYGFFSVTEDR